MKIITQNFFPVTLILMIFQLLHAENGNNQPNSFLIISPVSPLEMQLTPNFQAPFEPVKVGSFSLDEKIALIDPSKPYKDRKKAFFRSLILPGAGEYYLGKRTLAKTFFFSEISLWASYFAFREYGKWIRDDALAFAATHSGAQIKGKPSQFYVDIGNYLDVYQYNEAKQRLYQFDKVYTGEAYFWSWDSNNNRRKFDGMRIAGDRALNRSIFVLGGIFANHLISAIHAVWQTHRYNKKIDKLTNSRIYMVFNANYVMGEFSLQIQKEF